MSKKEDASNDDYPAATWRHRLRVLLLAVGTAIGIVLLLLYPPGGVKRHAPPPPPDAARCAEGQQDGCVGGRAAVIALPQAASSARP